MILVVVFSNTTLLKQHDYDNMNTRIIHTLQAIEKELAAVSSQNPSLMGGGAGIALYRFNYLQYFKQSDEQEDVLLNSINILAEQAATCELSTLSNGRAGINWLFTYLYRNDFLYREDLEALCSDEEQLAAIALDMLADGNYDLLHGATGIAYYLLYRKAGADEKWFTHFFDLLHNCMRKSAPGGCIPEYDFEAQDIKPGITNLGLAHGISSLLKLCCHCYTEGVCTTQAAGFAQNIIHYLLAHVNPDSTQNYFANTTGPGKEAGGFSRLAWCYGDLSAGYILQQAAMLFSNTKLAHFAHELLLHTTERKTAAETGVADAGVCHGTAGIVHLYNRLWHLQRIPAFRDARDYWIEQTLGMASLQDEGTGYKKYHPASGAYLHDNGLLEGIAGIGLVLLSYITEDFGWDYCLMLNA